MEQTTGTAIERFGSLIRSNSRYRYRMNEEGHLSFVLAGASKNALIQTGARFIPRQEVFTLLTGPFNSVELRKIEENIVVIGVNSDESFDLGTLPKDNGIDEALFEHYNSLLGSRERFVLETTVLEHAWGELSVVEIKVDFNIIAPVLTMVDLSKKRTRRPSVKKTAEPLVQVIAPVSDVINYDIVLEDLDDLKAFGLASAYAHYFITNIEAIL